jgi:lysyl-tRNA synthetase class II
MRMVLLSALALARAVRLAPTTGMLRLNAMARPAMLRIGGAGQAPRSRIWLVRSMADEAATLGDLPTTDEDGQPLSKNALKKLMKARQIAEKKAAKAAEGGGAGSGSSGDGDGGSEAAVDEAPAPWEFEDLGVVQSTRRLATSFSAVRDLGMAGGPGPGDEVTVRGRLSTVRGKGSSCFLVVRSGALHTVQAVFFKDSQFPQQSKAMLSRLQSLTEESIVEVAGTLRSADVLSCSQATVEIAISAVRLVSASAAKLPFEIEDASRSDAQVDASEATDRPFPRIGQELRLNNRWIDLRVPANQAILRVKGSVCALFRASLSAQGFVEVQTPKIVAGESEGGADVFRTDYFGTPACLAQSPQLYKQMAIASDMERVFEVGPVFRAEKSNTRRHLCEFVGLDMEMAFHYHYDEVIEVQKGRLGRALGGVGMRGGEEERQGFMRVCGAQYGDGVSLSLGSSRCRVGSGEGGAGRERDAGWGERKKESCASLWCWVWR